MAPKGTTNHVPRLVWTSRPEQIERLRLPFQIVETVNESRATRETDQRSLYDDLQRGLKVGWRNKLIWGDNKLVMGSLLKEFAGQIRLIYIDPPFATGDDFSVQIRVGDASVVKEPSILEEHAYRDTWGAGYDSYLSMMYERLILMHELLADDGALYLHCDPTASAYLRLLLDDVFGRENFRNEIVWHYYNKMHDSRKKLFPRATETIFFYVKNAQSGFVFNQLTELREKPFKQLARKKVQGRMINARDEEGKLIYREKLDRTVDNVWRLPGLQPASPERLGYPTQKPESLVERIVRASTNPGDLVADFFVGSGTTAAVAEKLGRRWIACDLGRFAIHTTRKRLLNIADCSPFEILNLGSYERQHWQKVSAENGMRDYVHFLLDLYEAAPVNGYRHLHGKKATRLVHVGAVDAPVTTTEVEQAMDELANNDLRAVDVLGWEWEMGLHEVVEEEARRRGLSVACRQIPREVMDAESGATIRFFELAYLEFQVDRDRRKVRVQLLDFVIPSHDLIPESLRNRIEKWSDYIDYWAVDFNFRDDTFHNEWQAYRTRAEPTLGLASDWHEYGSPGRYDVVVKVIDIFGNDTTRLAEVRVK